MTGLLDGATVPWYFVSGRHEPGVPISLPPPARRQPTPTPPTFTVVDLVQLVGAPAVKALADHLRRFR